MSAMWRTMISVGLVCAAMQPRPGQAADGVLTTPATVIRVGDHPGFGRVVFDLPPNATYNLVREGDRLLLVFQGAGSVVEPGSLPHNVQAIHAGSETATLELKPGSHPRTSRIGNRLVIDLLDRATSSKVRPAMVPAASAAPAPAPAPAPANVAIERPVVARSERPAEVVAAQAAASAPVVVPPPALITPQPAAPQADSAPALAAPVTPVVQQPLASAGDVVMPAVVAPQPAATISAPIPLDRAFLIRADSDVGAAAFRRGGLGVVVLDRRLPQQAGLSGVTWSSAAVSTVLQVPLAPDAALRLSRQDSGWSVEITRDPATGTLIAAPVADGLSLPLPRAGRMVTVLDPLSGGTLLVGASLGAGLDTGLAQGRQSPDYRLLSSWQGVVVEPSSDRVDLRSIATGFLVTGGATMVPATMVAQTRRFDFPNEPATAALNRMQAQLAGAAAAPPRGRARDRLAAIQSMIGLGMGVEAAALTQVTAAEDPQAAADAQTTGLGAVAAVLAGRPNEAAGLDDPRLDGTDEIMLWRGLRDRRLGRDTAAARGLGALAPLARSYPPSLRRSVWPDVAEAAVESGVAGPVEQLPRYAAALLLERSGKVDEALARYDELAAGSNRLDQVRGSARAAELRLASGRIGPVAAAVILERQSLAWRGDDQEAQFLLRAAMLRSAGREWRPALEALRAVESTFPAQKAAVQAQKAAVMESMLAAEGAGLSALDLVLLAADYADCVPEGPAGAAMARLLADKLTALDLPARAIPVLQGLMQASVAGEARAEFGARLSQMLLDGGDPTAAKAAFDASDAPDLSPLLRDRRGLLQARLLAARGEVAAAAAALQRLGTDEADDLRATILATAGDWPGSLAAITALAAKVVPSTGPLPAAAQDVLVRQANAAVQAQDAGALRSMARMAPRMEGARGDVFRLLTAAPLGNMADLPRSGRELASASALPQHLQTIGMR